MADDPVDIAGMVEQLEDALAAEVRAVEPPQPAAMPKTRSSRCLRALALLGGVASARAVAAHLGEELGQEQLTARQVRESLRQVDLRHLGAGYLALPGAVDPDLGPWLRGRLRRMGARRVEDLVDDILARWPHGDPVAIRGWLCQDPPGVAVVDGRARLVPGWKERSSQG